MTNGMFDEIVQQIIIKSNKIRIDLGGKHHPPGRYCYIWVETEHFNLIYVNLNNNKNKSYKTTNYNYSIWAFGLETGSGVPLMMEEISYQSPQQQHAWIQHATRILWESLGQLQPHTHGNQRHQQLLQSYLSIQKTVRLFNKTWSSLQIITLQCRLTFMSRKCTFLYKVTILDVTVEVWSEGIFGEGVSSAPSPIPHWKNPPLVKHPTTI